MDSTWRCARCAANGESDILEAALLALGTHILKAHPEAEPFSYAGHCSAGWGRFKYNTLLGRLAEDPSPVRTVHDLHNDLIWERVQRRWNAKGHAQSHPPKPGHVHSCPESLNKVIDDTMPEFDNCLCDWSHE